MLNFFRFLQVETHLDWVMHFATYLHSLLSFMPLYDVILLVILLPRLIDNKIVEILTESVPHSE